MFGAYFTLLWVPSPRLAFNKFITGRNIQLARCSNGHLVFCCLFASLHVPCLIQPFPSLITTFHYRHVSELPRLAHSVHLHAALDSDGCVRIKTWRRADLSRRFADRGASMGSPLMSCAWQKARTTTVSMLIGHVQVSMVRWFAAGVLMLWCSKRISISACSSCQKPQFTLSHLLSKDIHLALRQSLSTRKKHLTSIQNTPCFRKPSL